MDVGTGFDCVLNVTWMHSVLGWINFCGEEVCHENHENLYTTKISTLTVWHSKEKQNKKGFPKDLIKTSRREKLGYHDYQWRWTSVVVLWQIASLYTL